MTRPLRVAFADPPYLGQARRYDHPDASRYDTLPGHLELIDRLRSEYPDGWALACHVPSLRLLLPHCPEDVRIGAWVKPWCSWKRAVNPAYAWEPVIWRGGRPGRARGLRSPTVRDWVSANATLRRGLAGAKPEAYCRWLFELLGLRPGDVLDDLFPGTGAVGRAWEAWRRECRQGA